MAGAGYIIYDRLIFFDSVRRHINRHAGGGYNNP